MKILYNRVRFLLMPVTLLFCSHSYGAEFVFGRNGGLFCLDKNALDSFAAIELYRTINGMQDLGPTPSGCGAIQPETTANVSDFAKDGVRVSGTAVSPKLADGKPVFFVALEANTSPAAASTAINSTPTPAPVEAKRTYKIVGPEDVRNTPSKWIGRDIQFERVRVYWVADDDVRFLTRANLTLFGEDVRGDPQTLDFLRANCETAREVDMSKCVVSIKFRYTRHGEDNPGGLMKRTVLASDDIEVHRPLQRRR